MKLVPAGGHAPHAKNLMKIPGPLELAGSITFVFLVPHLPLCARTLCNDKSIWALQDKACHVEHLS